MAEASPALPIVQTLLLVGVLVTTTMVTCSNSRLEEQVIRLRKSVESSSYSSSSGAPAPSSNSGAASSAAQAREPGRGSGVQVVGWGGRRAEITYVEGAVPNAPLSLAQKPRPQNDWYVQAELSPPKNLNYYTTSDGLTARIVPYCLTRMIVVDLDHPPKTDPGLGLSTSCDLSDDKLTYTYHLRKGVQFADGRPFTSADVKFTFDVVRDPKVEANHLIGAYEDVENLFAPDPYTVVVKCKKKYWKTLYTVGFNLMPLNKAWYEEQIPEYAKKNGIEQFSTEPGKPGFGEVFRKIRIPGPGAGPYYLASEEDYTKDGLTLRQNPFYYGMQVRPEWYNFTQLRWRFIADKVAKQEAFRKQEIDVTVVDQDEWEDQLKHDETINRVASHWNYDHTGLDCNYIVWNCRQAPFDDKRVRTAMTHLMNRDFLLNEIDRGQGTYAVCKSKRSYPTYSNDLVPIPFDPAKAKALLAEAGWRDTNGDGVLDRDGKTFSFQLKFPSVNDQFPRICGLMKDACDKVGIQCQVVPVEWATFLEDLDLRRFDAMCLFSSWVNVWIDNYETYHSSQDVPRGGNVAGWRNARADELLTAMREEFDEDKRTEMFHEFNHIYYDEQPETLLVHGMVSVLSNKRFEGARIRPTGLQMVDFWVKPENTLHK